MPSSVSLGNDLVKFTYLPPGSILSYAPLPVKPSSHHFIPGPGRKPLRPAYTTTTSVSWATSGPIVLSMRLMQAAHR